MTASSIPYSLKRKATYKRRQGMQIRIAGIANDSIVDGPGLRYAVFTQGCLRHCEGCHNPETHSLDSGMMRETEDLIAGMSANPLLSGVTLSGGEPFLQPVPCARIALAAHDMGLNIWTYTGFTLEELLALENRDIQGLLDCTDVLVDGPFIKTERSLELKFRGSRNQRLIDMPRTQAAGNVVLWVPPVW
jgi:anaerobic ribonucleoside-triphosphate reductase activating protein